MKTIGRQTRNEREDQEKKNGRLELQCCNCGGKGHMSMKYPSMFGILGTASLAQNSPACSGTVEGHSIDGILLDTGCFRTMVHLA